MFRITPFRLGDHDEALKLEGKLSGAAVAELAKAVEACLERSPRLGLDLSELSFVDAEGTRLLRRLIGGRVDILRSSGFVDEILRS